MNTASASARVVAAAAREKRPWGRAILWLAALGPFFFLSYGAANQLASWRPHVGAIFFAWERAIPFLSWSIVPYWSIDALYGFSFFVCATGGELDRHGRRLVTAQVVAVACFILCPLRFAFARPAVDGIFGVFFSSLAQFDKPFNQAPSLHIALLVILWALYHSHVPRWAHWPLHLWFALIGASVLTTYQHHFIDVPTGVLLGFFCLWLWPDVDVSPLARASLSQDARRRRLAGCYALGAAALVALAVFGGGVALWLFWPAASLAVVAVNYAVAGAAGFQKAIDGRMSPAAQGLLAPYLVGAWINSRLQTRHRPAATEIGDGVFLGPLPSRKVAASFATVVDLCAELPGALGATHYQAVPTLDLITPPPALLREVTLIIERAREARPVLVCCTLGFSRSAAAVAAWRLATGRAASAEEAVAKIRRVAPWIVLDTAALAAIGRAGAAR